MSYQSVQHSIATRQNIALIRKSIRTDHRKVVDIGCNEGLVSMSLAMSGFDVVGIEASSAFSNAAEERSREKLKYGSLTVVKSALTFQNLHILDNASTILLLSVHHQFVSSLGLVEGNRLLIEVFKKAVNQFFFQPACIYEKYGCEMPFIENDYSSVEAYFRKLFFGIRDFKLKVIGLTDNRLPAREPLRPLMLFEFSETAAFAGLPCSPTELEERPSDIVQIPLRKCFSNYWFSYGPNGDHPMQKQVEQLLEHKGDLSLETTTLYTHYRTFQPSSYGEAAISRMSQPIQAPLGEHSTRKYLSLRDFESISTAGWGNLLNAAPKIPEWDQNLIGPLPDEKVLSEIKRLANLLQSLRKDGYNPYLFQDGFIRGYFLKSQGDWIFLVSAGMHRLSAMANLGYSYFQARLQPGSPSILDTEDENLPPDLRAYFKFFFTSQTRQNQG